MNKKLHKNCNNHIVIIYFLFLLERYLNLIKMIFAFAAWNIYSILSIPTCLRKIYSIPLFSIPPLIKLHPWSMTISYLSLTISWIIRSRKRQLHQWHSSWWLFCFRLVRFLLSNFVSLVNLHHFSNTSTNTAVSMS